MTREPRQDRSEIVPSQREGHAAWPAPATHQLAAVDRDYRALPVPERLIAGQEVHAGNQPESRGAQLGEGGVVAVVAQHDARPHREAVARRGPLLALLHGALTAAAEDRLERMVDGLHRRKEVGNFLHAL